LETEGKKAQLRKGIPAYGITPEKKKGHRREAEQLTYIRREKEGAPPTKKEERKKCIPKLLLEGKKEEGKNYTIKQRKAREEKKG